MIDDHEAVQADTFVREHLTGGVNLEEVSKSVNYSCKTLRLRTVYCKMKLNHFQKLTNFIFYVLDDNDIFYKLSYWLMVKYSSNELSSRMTIEYNYFFFDDMRKNKGIHLML